jgi:3-dehydroquinate dehydratase-2
MAERSVVEVMHGVNFDVLELRDSAHYGELSLTELEHRIVSFADKLGLAARFFQTNSEGEFVERLHEAARRSRSAGPYGEGPAALILNPGAWTHYSWAIHDALEIVTVPAVEVHLSALAEREGFRQTSVIGELCVATFAGHGVDGYRMALERLRQAVEAGG